MSVHWDSLLAVFVVSLGSAVAVVVLVALAMLGLSARVAVAEGLRTSVSPVRLRVAGTAAAGACLAVAACLLLPSFYVNPRVGNAFVLVAFTIVVLGGMGSLNGAMLGALVFGVAETMTSAYVSPSWATAVPYAIVFAVLLIRPQGLLGTRLREDTVAA